MTIDRAAGSLGVVVLLLSVGCYCQEHSLQQYDWELRVVCAMLGRIALITENDCCIALCSTLEAGLGYLTYSCLHLYNYDSTQLPSFM